MPAWRQPSSLSGSACQRLRRQRGQALVFGIFLLLAGLAGVYFLFNTGQMTAEKTRLVTTADAVAHGAGVMQARALNFDAYANRALVANEVLVAQMVSLSSWAQYAQTHADNLVWQFPECAEPYGYGAAFGAAFRYGPMYAALCYVTVQYAAEYISQIASEVPAVAEKVVAAAEFNKSAIVLAQRALHAPGALQKARADVMQEIADANYRGDGSVTASAQFESDRWPTFTHLYEGGARTRLAEVTRAAANTDAFVRQRNWTAGSGAAAVLGMDLCGGQAQELGQAARRHRTRQLRRVESRGHRVLLGSSQRRPPVSTLRQERTACCLRRAAGAPGKRGPGRVARCSRRVSRHQSRRARPCIVAAVEHVHRLALVLRHRPGTNEARRTRSQTRPEGQRDPCA